jgi:hypothetical protein
MKTSIARQNETLNAALLEAAKSGDVEKLQVTRDSL